MRTSHNTPLGLARRAEEQFEERRRCMRTAKIWKRNARPQESISRLVKYARALNHEALDKRNRSVAARQRPSGAVYAAAH